MGVPQALFDILTDAKYTESVSLGPNGAYFWKGTYGGRHCYRYLTHLPQLDGLIRIEQDDNGRILHSVAMGRSSGIALFTDGVGFVMGCELWVVLSGLTMLCGTCVQVWRSWDLSPNVMNVLRLTPKYIRVSTDVDMICGSWFVLSAFVANIDPDADTEHLPQLT